MRKYLPLVLVLTVGLAGCYGPFNLTKKVHKWNGEAFQNKWAKEGMFLVLNIVPVYGFAALGDAIIFNSFEFWGKKNPVQAKNVKSIQIGDEQAVLSYTPETKRLRVDSFRNGKLNQTTVFEQGPDGMVARNAQGTVIMTARTLDSGQIVLSDNNGKQVGTYSPDQLPQMLPQTN